MPGIADHPGVGRGKTQLQIATDRQFAELGVNFNEQVTDRNCAWVCNRGAGIQLLYGLGGGSFASPQVVDFSRQHGHPLQCTMEKE